MINNNAEKPSPDQLEEVGEEIEQKDKKRIPVEYSTSLVESAPKRILEADDIEKELDQIVKESMMTPGQLKDVRERHIKEKEDESEVSPQELEAIGEVPEIKNRGILLADIQHEIKEKEQELKELKGLEEAIEILDNPKEHKPEKVEKASYKKQKSENKGINEEDLQPKINKLKKIQKKKC